MIAAVLIRGPLGARGDVRDTMRMLNLTRKHSCSLIEDTPVSRGMLRKCKDFVAYGPVSDETAAALKKIMNDRTAHLHPPRGGLKSIKRQYTDGGDLGDRGEDMDALVKRMLP